MQIEGIAHKNLTDPQLHEPKGASSASLNQVPFADGEGSTSWQNITPDKLDINPSTVTEASENETTAPTVLDVLGLSATTDGICADGVNFTQTNKNIKELALKVNALVNYTTSLQASYNDLVTKYNALQTALQTLGFISIGE